VYGDPGAWLLLVGVAEGEVSAGLIVIVTDALASFNQQGWQG
jgi:hypothetical protein